MKIIFFGNGVRGYKCLTKLLDKQSDIKAVVCNNEKSTNWISDADKILNSKGIDIIYSDNPNGDEFVKILKQYDADLFILAGYSKIVKKNLYSIPKLMTINLHGGKLPQIRGSSPMNWALIKGETEFTLNVIKVDSGVDTGDILLKRTFEITENTSIAEVHEIANKEFPEMLVEVIELLEKNKLTPIPQSKEDSGYYPLRFPEDGLIIWDMLTSNQIHNRIRALTKPYPCAYTYFKDRKVVLISSSILENNYFGEAGRIYKITKEGLYICASDKCLLIKEAVFADDSKPLAEVVKRYEKLITVREKIESLIGRK